MKTLLLPTLAAVLLSGCVTVPIPPFGDRIGELGSVKLSLKVEYLPALSERRADSGTDHAFRQLLLNPPTLKDK